MCRSLLKILTTYENSSPNLHTYPTLRIGLGYAATWARIFSKNSGRGKAAHPHARKVCPGTTKGVVQLSEDWLYTGFFVQFVVPYPSSRRVSTMARCRRSWLDQTHFQTPGALYLNSLKRLLACATLFALRRKSFRINI